MVTGVNHGGTRPQEFSGGGALMQIAPSQILSCFKIFQAPELLTLQCEPKERAEKYRSEFTKTPPFERKTHFSGDGASTLPRPFVWWE